MSSWFVSPWVELVTFLICWVLVYPTYWEWRLARRKQALLVSSKAVCTTRDRQQGELFDLINAPKKSRQSCQATQAAAHISKPENIQPSLLDAPSSQPIDWPTHNYTKSLMLTGTEVMLRMVDQELRRLPQSADSENHARWMSIISQAASHQADHLKRKDLIPLVADELELPSDSVVEKLIKSTHAGGESLFGQIIENIANKH